MQKTLKFIIPLIALLTIGFRPLQAQGHKTGIMEKLDIYFKATEEKNWEGVLDMIYPKLFDLASREDLIAVFENMEAEGMELHMSDMKVRDISGLEIFEGEQFALVDYSMKMKIKFTGEDFSDKEAIQMMKGAFEGIYGAENIVVDEEEASFDIQVEKSMFAIAGIGSSDWKFIEQNKGQDYLMDQLLPKEIREKFE
jgi:hypothetical protein